MPVNKAKDPKESAGSNSKPLRTALFASPVVARDLKAGRLSEYCEVYEIGPNRLPLSADGLRDEYDRCVLVLTELPTTSPAMVRSLADLSSVLQLMEKVYGGDFGDAPASSFCVYQASTLDYRRFYAALSDSLPFHEAVKYARKHIKLSEALVEFVRELDDDEEVGEENAPA